MSESIQISDPAEIAAVASGEIIGDQYEDGETWADAISLIRWRNRQPLSRLEDGIPVLTDAVSP